jgi:serine protease AprX
MSKRREGGSEAPARRAPRRPESDPSQKPFTPETLDRTVIAIPLLDRIDRDGADTVQNVIIDVNLEYPGGRRAAREQIWRWIDELVAPAETAESKPKRRGRRAPERPSGSEGVNRAKSEYSQQYLFGRLSGRNIRALVVRDQNERETAREKDGKPWPPALYRIWLDHEVARLTNVSVSTVKADAARNAFGALGKGITWAVVDTGIDGLHLHFAEHRNLELALPLRHRDFTGSGEGTADELERRALVDRAGHGTHVAGIIAGEFRATGGRRIVARFRERDEFGEVTTEERDDIPLISGMAPQCQLLSLRTLDDDGRGLASNLIAALEYVQELNGNGRRLRVHGVNMSVGYDFEPKWFACGQSPLCVEVDRLVRSGVVVVVAAGNTGYGYNQPETPGPAAAGLDLTINDPGNADLAITVGATHREMPHVYGVSYFSSKGPTGDGRLKPDLVAPGEKIISCASAQAANDGKSSAGQEQSSDGANVQVGHYREDSGTSMAAPHVSGVIAAFLSIRREFIGRPDRVKELFLSTATDLRRAVYFQGKGLVDLMRAIQSV